MGHAVHSSKQPVVQFGGRDRGKALGRLRQVGMRMSRSEAKKSAPMKKKKKKSDRSGGYRSAMALCGPVVEQATTECP